MSSSYDVGGRSGHSVLEFSIHEHGNYEFACGYGGNSQGLEVVAAFVSVAMFLAVIVPVLVMRYRAW
jgi:hypothetical protein